MSKKIPKMHSKLSWKDLFHQKLIVFFPLNNERALLPMLPGSDPWAMFLIETVQAPVRTWFIFTSASTNLSTIYLNNISMPGFWGQARLWWKRQAGKESFTTQPERDLKTLTWRRFGGVDLLTTNMSSLSTYSDQLEKLVPYCLDFRIDFSWIWVNVRRATTC